MFVDYFISTRLQNFRIKQMLSQLDSLSHIILRNSKRYINFEIFARSRNGMNSTSQIYINAYTLILEKKS